MLWYNACLCITALFVFLGLSLWIIKKILQIKKKTTYFMSPWASKIIAKYEKRGKYLPILHEATCDNYFSVKFSVFICVIIT